MRICSACLLLSCAALLVSAAVGLDSSESTEEFIHQAQWAQFKLRYQKEYQSVDEESVRYELFKKNLVRAAWLQMENPGASFGVTQFSDLSQEEFKSTYLGYRPGAASGSRLESMNFKPKACQKIADGSMASPNADVDWRTKGAVSAVKDQGKCGSCWAFSAVEGVESAWFLKHNSTVPGPVAVAVAVAVPVLSPQQVVSCAHSRVDQGCNGGDLPPAFKYIQDNGLEAESSYPYASGSTGITGKCKFSASSVVVNITGFSYATPPCTDACKHQDEATLLSNLASHGPSSLCLNADPWQHYVSGVLSGGCPGSAYDLNHCVQLVGYQTSSPKNYWIVRNSWGTSWGQNGYIYLAYGTNVCGLADEATFVTAA